MPTSNYRRDIHGNWGWETRYAPGELAYLSRNTGDQSGGQVALSLLGLVLLVCGYSATGWPPAADLAAARDLRHVVVVFLGSGGATVAGVVTMLLALSLTIGANLRR
jgi:hypothetical protein